MHHFHMEAELVSKRTYLLPYSLNSGGQAGPGPWYNTLGNKSSESHCLSHQGGWAVFGALGKKESGPPLGLPGLSLGQR